MNSENRVSDLGINRRALNCLMTSGILTVGDLVKRTDKELMNVTGLSVKTLDNIKEALTAAGLRLGGTVKPNNEIAELLKELIDLTKKQIELLEQNKEYLESIGAGIGEVARNTW